MQVARTGMDAFVSIWSSSASPGGHDSQALDLTAVPGADQAAGLPPQQTSSSSIHMGAQATLPSVQSSRRFMTGLVWLAAAATVATVARAFSFAYAGLRAAKHVHLDLLHGCGTFHSMLTCCCWIPLTENVDTWQP
jgi:hypothetical protein